MMTVFLGLFLEAPAKDGNLRKFKKADKYYEVADYAQALRLYREIYSAGDSLDADLNFKIGICIWGMKQNERSARPYFERSAPYVTEAHYYLGCIYHLELRFDDAVKEYLAYKNDPFDKEFSNKEIDRMIAMSVIAQERITKPVNAEVVNVGPVINTKWPEYVPLVSADESILMFTSRREGSTGGQLDPYGRYYEDVYISYKDSSGQWSAPKSLSDNINTATHDACVALAPGGEELIIYRTDAKQTGGDLYVTRFDGKTWTLPVMLSTEINTDGWEASATLTADGNTMYFSSNRKESFGQKDIYCVKKLPTGQWSKAQNLGEHINSAYDEDAPFIHPDGKTLYFSSRGLTSMGGFDVFKCSLDEETGKWSAPENLGFPINTVDDDIFYTTTANGQYGYYSSGREGGTGETDIYQVRFPERAFNLDVINTLVLSEGDSAVPVLARITLFDMETLKMQGMYRTNKLTGKCILLAAPLRKYKVVVEAEGYFPWTQEVEFDKGIFTVNLPKKNKP
ncbi:MAG: ompA [Bacteroidetes bacterium]|nr:MAG: ompA [Bacteroidota bacterium]